MSLLSRAALIVHFLWLVPAVLGQSICARVGVQLSQEAVISRGAFRATLVINNDSIDALTDIGVSLDVLDPSGNQGTMNFGGVTSPTVSGALTAVDGTGILPAGTSGSAEWILIPFDDAAPDGPLVYGFGGTLSYTTSQGELHVPLNPVYLTVYPNPKLRARYFWERDVFSDDPLTVDEQEPVRPFSVGLMLSNIGAGVANNVRFTSAQPIITRNDRGLLIDFQLIGSQAQCDQISPSLTFNLGNLQGNTTRVARWLMTSSLSGHFENYQVSMQHIDGLGDPRLSLFEEPLEPPHELIHAVRSQETGADCAPDFLVSDLSPFTTPPDPFELESDPERLHLPDRVYMSESGAFEPVTPVFGAVVTPQSQLRATITATVPSTGWFSIKVPDPGQAAYQLVSLTRSDGRQIEVGTNAWQTDRVFRDNDLVPLRLNRLHIFDKGGSGNYTAIYAPIGGPPRMDSWEVLANHGSDEIATLVSGNPEYSESRVGAMQKIRVRFSRPIRAESLSSTSVSVVGLDVAGNSVPLSDLTWNTSLSFDQRTAIINFSRPLNDRARYCVTLGGVTDPFNNLFATGNRVVFTVLEGDAFADRRTNNSDVGGIRSLLGMAFDSLNPLHVRSDLNRDAVLSQEDVNIAITRRGTDTRGIPNPCGNLVIGTEDDISPPKSSNTSGVPTLDPVVDNPPPDRSFTAAEIDPIDDGRLLGGPRIVFSSALRTEEVAWSTILQSQPAGDVGNGEELQAALEPNVAALWFGAIDPSTQALKELESSDITLLRAGKSGWWLATADSFDSLSRVCVKHVERGGYYSEVYSSADSKWLVIEPRVRIELPDGLSADRLVATLNQRDIECVVDHKLDADCCTLVVPTGTTEMALLTATQASRISGVQACQITVRSLSPVRVRSDFTLDGTVDEQDVQACLTAISRGDQRADIDGNGVVDAADAVAVAGCISKE